MKKKAVCLLSDGLDSPVATFLLEQKKIDVIGLNFLNNPYIDFVSKEVERNNEYSNKLLQSSQIRNIAQALVNSFTYQSKINLFIEAHGIDLKRIIKSKIDKRYICILCKRLMLRKAEYLAEKLGAELIATGEILGEQASQTIYNLKVIEEVLQKKGLIRPVIGLNKEDIINLAKKIGTFKYSEIAARVFCTAVPKKPATQTTLNRIILLEEGLKLDTFIEESFQSATKLTLYKQVGI